MIHENGQKQRPRTGMADSLIPKFALELAIFDDDQASGIEEDL
jgi:hypothetical protein